MNWYKLSSEISPIQGPMPIIPKNTSDTGQGKKEKDPKKEESQKSFKDMKKEFDEMTHEKLKKIIEENKK